jgi:hypothetical protein
MDVLSDACPVCFPGDAPAALPSAMRIGGEGDLTANYSCQLCGLEWRTSWKVATAWPAARVYARPFPLLDEAIALLVELLDGEELEAA